MDKVLVTGGAGFIGSHVVDRLVSRGIKVMVYDNFSSADGRHLTHAQATGFLEIVEADVLDLEKLKTASKGCDTIFHFQANADVRGGIENRRIDLEQNTIATWNVCEAAVAEGIKTIAFASSATVYGEPVIFPTPEEVAPIQTSLYGASKYACEATLQAYANYFNIQVRLFRFVSWTGPRYSHGVVVDFYNKLLENPKQLLILGDGLQRKSYLDVRDGVNGIFTVLENYKGLVGIFNLGNDNWINVKHLANIVCEEMGLDQVAYHYGGGERGWLGDSPFVHLDTQRLKSLGWQAKVSIEQSIRDTIVDLMAK